MTHLSVPAEARISYNLTLDSTRKVPSNRASYVDTKQREMRGTVNLVLQQLECVNLVYHIEVSR